LAMTSLCAAAQPPKPPTSGPRPVPPGMGLSPADMAMVTNNPAQVVKEGSYAYGVRQARGIKQQNVPIDVDEWVRGIAEEMKGKGANGSTNALSEAEITSRMKRLTEVMKIEGEKRAEETRIKGLAWLEENKKKPGVVVLPDGLQYKVIKEGTGEQPHSTNLAFVNYRGKFIDGTEFDENYSSGKPTKFDLRGGVVKGFSETLELMKVGGQIEAYIPPDLAYGVKGKPARGKVGVPPNAVLVFDMELVGVSNAPAPVTLKAPAAGNQGPPPAVTKAPQPGGAVQTSQILQVNPDGTSKLLPANAGTSGNPPPPPTPPPVPKP